MLSTPPAPTVDHNPGRPPAVARSLRLDGTPLVQRVGRLVRQERWWVLVPDSDRIDAADGPLRLLPNQAVETMMRESQRGGQTVFVVSGEITLFENENYLLPRSVTRRVDLGNFRR